MASPDDNAPTLMIQFAERTGLVPGRAPRRYLWTDAFALFNYLALFEQVGEVRYRKLARDLIDQVHEVLGRHRADDMRGEWLSGLPEAEGRAHPTRGGLRIGKPLPDREPDEAFDPRLEWDRDGQYFHYLTKWMEALSAAAAALDEPRYQQQAVELAVAVFPRFLQYGRSGKPSGLAWKMNIDLSRPLVAGSSPHDVLDGYITFRRLQAAQVETRSSELDSAIPVLRELLVGHDWTTPDPLGLGGLLLDADRLAALADRSSDEERLAGTILVGAARGLQRFLDQGVLHLPPSQRLGFRELGLAIGLRAVPAIAAEADRSPGLADSAGKSIAALVARDDLAQQIAGFWAGPGPRDTSAWRDHLDINEVMLATALIGTPLPLAQRTRLSMA